MSFFKSLMRCKPYDMAERQQNVLKRCLGAMDLTLLGIGAVIGAGVFVVTGIAAATKAGPAVIISYFIAGLACSLSALAYAELSSSIGGAGSAYGYTYVGLGELLAWIIGWDLLLEYGLAVASVAVGWAGYVTGAFAAIGIHLPQALTQSPADHGIVNLPAMFIVFAIMGLLMLGTRQSARFNSVMVFVKIAAIALFIGVASFHFNIQNWHPFAPFGFSGIMSGAALIFFAFIGFDAVSTAAEETINPKRTLPIGILASLAVCTLIYILVAGLLTGAAPSSTLNSSSPVADVLLGLGQRFVAGTVSVGAIAGLTTVIMVMFFGLTRIIWALGRDGLVSSKVSKVSVKTQTPIRLILGTGVVMALLAGFVPLERLAELVNIGTLFAFVLVCLSTAIMRYTKPTMPRPFKIIWGPLIPICGIVLNIYLMISLPKITWLCFVLWTLIGLVIYFSYGRRNSVLGKEASAGV